MNMNRGVLLLLLGIVLGIAAYIPAKTAAAPFWKPAPKAPIRVMFGGDIMLDRSVARTAAADGPEALFAGIAEAFNDSDIRIANLEGTITANPSIAQVDHTILRFTFDPTIAERSLAPLRLSAVSLANNHTLDFASAGYAETHDNLEAFGIGAFGQPLNATGKLSTMVEYGGKKFCFVGYHALYDPATSTVAAEIQALRPGCWKIAVISHWGVEYEHVADDTQRSAAHAFIDAGADLVVGAHPHVVQGHEVYQGKAIFYSLGNFMFDQNFSWGTTHGMLLRADFSDTETHFVLIPTVLRQQKVGLAVGEDRQKVLDFAGIRLPDGQVAEFSLP
jgi:poly-gamma-glutamate synthesis protein (capsule biosynthesis protein)